MELRLGEYPTRIFLLGQLYDTNFVKDTPGGMLGSKQYFDVSKFKAEDAKELSGCLKDLAWSELNK